MHYHKTKMNHDVNNNASYNHYVLIKRTKGKKQYSSKGWSLASDHCSFECNASLLHHFLTIPINEITSIKWLSNSNSKTEFEMYLSDTTILTIRMDSLAYTAFKEKFNLMGNKPKGVDLPVEVKSENTLIYRRAAIAAVVMFGIMVLSGEDNKSGTSSSNTESNPNHVSSDISVTQTQADALKKLIRAYGYSCNSLSSAIQSSYDGSYSVTCNNWQYRYDIEDVGGNWVVTVN